MRRVIAIALASIATPALARETEHPVDHAVQSMPGMDMPTSPATARQTSAGDAQTSEPAGTDQPPGSAEAPPVTYDHPEDRYWNPAEMAAAEKAAMHPPAATYAKLAVDILEYRFRKGRDGYQWEGEIWFGDLDRFVLKTRGEGISGKDPDRAEVQALYAKALDPWWNLQMGLRQDIRPDPARTWATLGLEGRSPYQFALQAAAFLSDKGQVTARLEGAYDQRITQRLVLQPRLELNLSAQDMPAERVGAGLSATELGLRLRYEVKREFAPYVGVNWTWTLGKTADYARANGKDTAERGIVTGIRLWF